MARIRDYAAEYARRKALHPGEVTRARGHGTRERESVERGLRRQLIKGNVRVNREGEIVRRGYEGGKRPSLKGVIDRYGQENLRSYLDQQKAASKAYERGDVEQARRLWTERDRDLPEWLFWYHGVFG